MLCRYFVQFTHLPNRRLLQDRLSQELAAANHNGLYGVILFLDLDNFKTLNDTRGHDAGDRLLVEVARRLRAAVREGDIVGRPGGDEFVVLLEDLSKDTEVAVMLTKQVGEKVRNDLARPYSLDGYEFHCTASIGIRLFRDQETAELDSPHRSVGVGNRLRPAQGMGGLFAYPAFAACRQRQCVPVPASGFCRVDATGAAQECDQF